MPAESIHHIYIETHNWGKSVAFWRALGFQLSDDRGTSGMLRPSGGGPYIYLAEVPADRKAAVELYLAATDETAPERPAEVRAKEGRRLRSLLEGCRRTGHYFSSKIAEFARPSIRRCTGRA